MTPAQLQVLSDDIDAKDNAGGPLNGLSDSQITDYYNAISTPDFWVYRTRVSKDEYSTDVS